MTRALKLDVAASQGMHCVVGLVDISKFFDSIKISELIQAAMENEFDPVLLYLVLSVHLAPRRLMIETAGGACYSDCIGVGDWSILAGCVFSIDLTKLVMARVLERVLLQHPGQPMQTWVDDLFLYMVSKCPESLATHFADVIYSTRSSLAGSGLEMNVVKSSALASSSELRRLLTTALKTKGVKMPVASTGKDLGLDLNLGKKRSIKTQNARFLGAVARSLRVRKLIGKTMKACSGKLHRNGVFPKARWGAQACGMSPAAVVRLRQRYVVDGGLRKQGGCTSTAIQIDSSIENDPIYFITADLIQAWLTIAPTIKEAVLERAWEINLRSCALSEDGTRLQL